MKNVKKIIKFRKEDEHKYSFDHYIGMAPESSQKPKKPAKLPMQVSPIANHKKIIKPIQNDQRLKYEHLISPDQKGSKPHPIQREYQQDYILTDNEDFLLSSVKKKAQKVKLSIPKAFEQIMILQNYRDPVLNDLKRSEPVMSIDEIFSLEIMQKIMGIVPQEQRMVHKDSNHEIGVFSDIKKVNENKISPENKVIAFKQKAQYIDVDEQSKQKLEIIYEQSDASHLNFGFQPANNTYARYYRNQYEAEEEIQVDNDGKDCKSFSEDCGSSQGKSSNAYEMQFYNSQLYSHGFGAPENQFMSFRGLNYGENHINRQEPSHNERDNRRNRVREENFQFNTPYQASFGQQRMHFVSDDNAVQQKTGSDNFFSEKKPQYHNQYHIYEPDSVSHGYQSNFMSGSERGYTANNYRKKEIQNQKAEMAKMKKNKVNERR